MIILELAFINNYNYDDPVQIADSSITSVNFL